MIWGVIGLGSLCCTGQSFLKKELGFNFPASYFSLGIRMFSRELGKKEKNDHLNFEYSYNLLYVSLGMPHMLEQSSKMAALMIWGRGYVASLNGSLFLH